MFGIEAKYMQRFREILTEEGLPGNEERVSVRIPLNVTYDFGKKLQILRPKKKRDGGGRYDFKADGPVPSVGEIPEYLKTHRVKVDHYPRIEALASTEASTKGTKTPQQLGAAQLAMLDFDELYFELERYKAQRSWHNFNVTKEGIRKVLGSHEWYELLMPESLLKPDRYAGVRRLQRIALELLKGYCDRLYKYKKREFLEPRLQYQELTSEDDNIPEDPFYTITVDGSEDSLVTQLRRFAEKMASDEPPLEQFKKIKLCTFSRHLFEPLLHAARGSKLTIRPVSLNESEFQFVSDLKTWCETNETHLSESGLDLYLLRNLSRGKGVGFFEASNFHPDFIMWLVRGEHQYVTFVDPHGLQHTGVGDPRIQLATDIKSIEQRLGHGAVSLDSFILSPTRQTDLSYEYSKEELEERHVLFMRDENYLDRLFRHIGAWH